MALNDNSITKLKFANNYSSSCGACTDLPSYVYRGFQVLQTMHGTSQHHGNQDVCCSQQPAYPGIGKRKDKWGNLRSLAKHFELKRVETAECFHLHKRGQLAGVYGRLRNSTMYVSWQLTASCNVTQRKVALHPPIQLPDESAHKIAVHLLWTKKL